MTVATYPWAPPLSSPSRMNENLVLTEQLVKVLIKWEEIPIGSPLNCCLSTTAAPMGVPKSDSLATQYRWAKVFHFDRTYGSRQPRRRVQTIDRDLGDDDRRRSAERSGGHRHAAVH